MSQLYKRILSTIFLLPLGFFIIVSGSYIFNFFLILCMILILIEWYKISKIISYNFLGYLFIFFSFFSIYYLRQRFDTDGFMLIIITTICVSTDIGGFIFGNIFKGPKLTKISPNKTYSGLFGSYFLSFLLTFLLINFLFDDIVKIIIFKNLVIFIFIISSTSQIGDLIISFIKRLSKIKDTGQIIPGHGGLLDRFDGMIFAFPTSYIILINGFELFH